MIETISGLIEKGYAYPADGDVYFNVARDEDYGKLCGFDPEAAGSRLADRGEHEEEKPRRLRPVEEVPSRASRRGTARGARAGRAGISSARRWPSSTSARRSTSTAAGSTCRFPHHENELAQSRILRPASRSPASGCTTACLKMGSGKMAGSVGNVLNVERALKHVSGEALRFFILNTHYRSPIDLGEWDPRDPQSPRIPPGLESAKKAHDSFMRLAERFDRVTGKKFYDAAVPTRVQEERQFSRPEFGELLTRFREHMDDDFNTGGAVGVLFELVNSLNRLADAAKLEDPAKADATGKAQFEEGAQLAKELGQILGLFFEAPSAGTLGGDDKIVAGLMQLVIELRNNLRAEAKKIAGKDDPTKKMLFGQTDIIRTRLAELGITLEDRPAGTTWRVG